MPRNGVAPPARPQSARPAQPGTLAALYPASAEGGDDGQTEEELPRPDGPITEVVGREPHSFLRAGSKSDWESQCLGRSWGTGCKVGQTRQGSGKMAIGPYKPVSRVAAGWQIADGADSASIRLEQLDDRVNPSLVEGFGDTTGTAPCREDVVTPAEIVGNDAIVPVACSAPDAKIGEVSGKVGWVRSTQCEKVEHCDLTGAREALVYIVLDASDRAVGALRVGGTRVLEHDGHKLIALAVAPEGNVKRVAVGAVSREARADTADINVFVMGDLTTKARHWTVPAVGALPIPRMAPEGPKRNSVWH